MTTSNPNHPGEGSTPGDTGNGSPKQKMEQDIRGLKREAGAKGREQAEAGQHRLAAEADTLSDAIDTAASSLDDHDREGLARYARELSSNLANAAGQLEDRSVDELANDAKRLARNNPAMFMLGSIAVGFGLSRFFKASAEHDHDSDDRTHGADDVTTGTPMQARDRHMTETHKTSTATSIGEGREIR